MTSTNADKIQIDGVVASLWRFNEDLGCYAIVFPAEESNLYHILRSKTFTREDQGLEQGPYLYTVTQYQGNI